MREPMKPCPFCGVMGEVTRLKEDWWVECESCGSSGAKVHSPEAAVTIWNVRYSRDEADGEALWEVIDALGALDRPWELEGHGIPARRAEAICDRAQQWRLAHPSRSEGKG